MSTMLKESAYRYYVTNYIRGKIDEGISLWE